jgi:thioredoxin-dependent peroxiredoxin
MTASQPRKLSGLPKPSFLDPLLFLDSLRLRSKTWGMNIKNIILSAFVCLGTFSLMAAKTQQQPEVGKAAPDFSLTTGDGSQVSLKDFKGKWVVLYFYPKDFTSGCTMEARNFQRDLSKYEEAGAVILGVSVDTAQSHKDFCAKEGLNFKLLADPDGKISTEYGSVMDYKGQKLAARNTFIINPKGEIAKVYTGVKPADHSEQVLKDLAELKKS